MTLYMSERMTSCDSRGHSKIGPGQATSCGVLVNSVARSEHATRTVCQIAPVRPWTSEQTRSNDVKVFPQRRALAACCDWTLLKRVQPSPGR